jgi:hypothetical protein
LVDLLASYKVRLPFEQSGGSTLLSTCKQFVDLVFSFRNTPGARARADRFASQSELKQLQNELRSGLRELDAVKSELAVSMSPSAMMGRTLGPMTANADNISRASISPQQNLLQSSLSGKAHQSEMSSDSANKSLSISQTPQPTSDQHFMSQSSINQSSLAVAEQVWANQGIGFASAAERGIGLSSSNSGYNHENSGSVVLSKLLQESLIFDQYDRIVAEQNAALQSKASTIEYKYRSAQEASHCKQDDSLGKLEDGKGGINTR